MSFSDILSFFLYVIPGFISTEIYKSVYPGKKVSDFTHLTWSISLSICFFIFTRWVDSLLKWNLYPFGVKFPRIRTIFILILLSIIFALLRILKNLLADKFEWLKFIKVKPLAIWPFVNNDPEWACVTLTNGAKYLGWISEWTYDPNETDQDFLLADAERVDEEFNTIYKIDGKGVYLKTSWVVSIEFFKGQSIDEKEGSQITLEQAAPTKEELNINKI